MNDQVVPLPSPVGNCFGWLRRRLVRPKIKMADEGKALPMFVIDAFTSKAFGGNPAAVCLVGSNVSDVF